MLSSNDVRDVSFGKSVSGYNKDEVDAFLDNVEEDYKKYEAYVQSLQEKIATLTTEANEYKASSESLKNVLVSAQQLADKIVKEAKDEAETIKANAVNAANEATAEAKAMLSDFDQKLAAKRALSEKQAADELAKAQKQQDAVKLVTDEIIRKQQASFDRLKIEIAQFKKDVIGQYKQHLELISKLPEDVVMDAQRVAKAIEYEIENEPEEVSEPEPAAEEPEEKATPEEIFKIEPEEIEQEMTEGGFVVNIEDDDTYLEDVGEEAEYEEEQDEEPKDEESGFSNEFFSKNRK